MNEVHAAGIIHRDIKPENFFLKGNVPKLGDFGLSLDFDLPPVTQSVSDIFGTVAYMAPEQFYNFSMAREPADVYAVGKILYESVEGKMSDKAKPFKQARLSQPEGAFLESLNRIIMAATEENPGRRIGSVRELKDQLMQLIRNGAVRAGQKQSHRLYRSAGTKLMLMLILAGMLLAGAGLMHLLHNGQPPAQTNAGKPPVVQDTLESVASLPYPDTLKETTHTEDGSMLYLVPPAELKFSTDVMPGMEQVAIAPLYISKTPVTNQQYVDFLNKNLDRIEIIDDSVYLDHRLALKIREKIQGFKPVVFSNGVFAVQEAMHAACAVLMVTGAEAYAVFYNMRLPRPKEWLYVKETGGISTETRLELPAPVMNYAPDKYNLRGINQVGEWGKTAQGEWVVMGRNPSKGSSMTALPKADPADYFADTSLPVRRAGIHGSRKIRRSLMKPLSIVLITICALIVAAVAFAVSGLYNVSARVPHLAPTTMLLEMVRNRSISHHSSNVDMPALDDPEVAMAGAVHFDATCRKCHGAPGKPQEEFAQGLYPNPPLLSATARQRSRKEIFWIIDNGLKMTGMPAFGGNHEPEEISAMAAFIKKLPELDEQAYAQFVQQAMAHGGEDHHHGDSEPHEHPDEPHGHTHKSNEK